MSSVVDVIYQRMKDDTEMVVEDKGESELVKFYSGLNLLVTGATDHFGKCLLEKLLRDCPDVKKIYVLVRVRRSESFEEKCNRIYEDNVFANLKKLTPDFRAKLCPIKGDLTQQNLGLSDTDRLTLLENVNMIFHNGAASKLNEQITVALKTNVLGTKHMLDLARECKQLRAFVLVSSAYSHCHERVIEEKFYRTPADLKTVADMMAADATGNGLTQESLRMMLGEWPNVFTYTKATAEELVQSYAPRSSFACCVFRPSAVISSYKEPQPGWCDPKNGPASLFVKISRGAVHVMRKFDYPVDLVPVDMSVNASLVCAWDAVERWQVEPEAFVYNYGSSQEKPITMDQLREKITGSEQNALVSSKSLRKPYVVFASNFVVYLVLRAILDYVPALIVDLLTILHGRAPEQCALVRESMADMCRLYRFCAGNWRVRMDETLKACDKLNPRDRELFFCDVRRFDWDDYFLYFWRGIRSNVIKDSFDGSTANTADGGCSRCPCNCPCKCVCYGATLAIGFVAYYLMNCLFF